MTRLSTITYWALALLFAWGLANATYDIIAGGWTQWRMPLWWGATLGAHLARLPLVPFLWIGLFIDGIEGYMLFLYAAQPSNAATIPVIAIPLIPLVLSLYVWRRGHYITPNFSKGDT